MLKVKISYQLIYQLIIISYQCITYLPVYLYSNYRTCTVCTKPTPWQIISALKKNGALSNIPKDQIYKYYAKAQVMKIIFAGIRHGI